MRFTTSKYISILFSIYTLAVVLFFGIAINIIFFRQRYAGEMIKITRSIQQDIAKENRPKGEPNFAQNIFSGNIVRNDNHPDENNPRFADISTIRFDYSSGLQNELKASTIFSNLAKVSDQYILYVNRNNKTLYVLPVTRLAEAQISMIKLFLALLMVFGGISYLFSKFLVKKSLRNLNKLVNFVKTMNIDNLERKVPIDGPKDDEINTIAYAIQNSSNLLAQQAKSLKSFVSYASHELKTPIMSLNSAIDAGEKTGNYEKAFKKVKDGAGRMNGLINTLVDTTLAEQKILERKKIDIIPIINLNINQQKEIFLAKNIGLKIVLPKKYIILGDENGADIVFKNLIQNAYKYAPQNTDIEIKLEKNIFSISNIGDISQDGENIRQRFWKKSENSQGYGIGLYLTKLMSEKMSWKIDVVQEKEKTKFFIKF